MIQKLLHRRRFTAGRLAGAAGRAMVVVLVLFHGWLLGRRWGDGVLFQPEVGVRWLLTLALGLCWWLARRADIGSSKRTSLALVAVLMLLHSGLPMPLTYLGVLLAALPLTALGGLLLPLTVATLVLDALVAAQHDPVGPAAAWRSMPAHLSFSPAIPAYPPSFCRPPPS